MKLIYWVADHRSNDPRKAIRDKRQIDALEAVRRYPREYTKPRKVVLEYSSTFELLLQCSRSDAFTWEKEPPS